MGRPQNTATWLAPLIRAVCQRDRTARPIPTLTPAADFEAWLAATVESRGYPYGMPCDLLGILGEDIDQVSYDAYTLRNATAHMLDLGAAVLSQPALALDPEIIPRKLLLTLALWLDDDGATQQAVSVLDAAPEQILTRRITALVSALGSRLSERALSTGDPLLGHPFHQMLLLSEARAFARIARLVALAHHDPGGVPDLGAVAGALGVARSALHHALSACAALIAADGVIAPRERRLIDALCEAAHLSEEEQAMLEEELVKPVTPQQLADELSDPIWRHALLRVLFLAAGVDGDIAPPEQLFLETLGAAFGMTADELGVLEVEALVHLQQHGRLDEAFKLAGRLGRLRDRLSKRIDDVIRDNSTRLWSEIKQTSELGQLLAKASVEPLTAEEKARAQAQLIDLCRAVPALAIFAAPGGSLLLPILIKHLPFKIVPSSFSDEETL